MTAPLPPPGYRDDDVPISARDIESSSRSCLAIVVMLGIILVLIIVFLLWNWFRS